MSDEPIRIRYLETTGRCNMDCPVCVERYRNFDMKQEDFLNIVEKNEKVLKGNCLWIDFNGEPMIDPLFFERIRILKSKGVIVQTTTNGLLLDRDNIIQLVESGLDYLAVSVSTLNPEIYREIRGVDCLDQVLENVKQLKAYAEKKHSNMEIQAVAIDTGLENPDYFISYFHSLGLHAAVHQFTNRAHCSRKEYKINHNMAVNRGACLGRKQNLIILCNCDVIPCCCDYMGTNVLGNLRDYDYSILRLIENSDIESFISDQETQIYKGICEKCEDWIYFQKDSVERYVTVYPVQGGIE